MNDMVNFDYQRSCRNGFGEAVLAEGKTIEDLTAILEELTPRTPVIVTRLAESVYYWILEHLPTVGDHYTYNACARVLRSKKNAELAVDSDFSVAIVAAGTSDRTVVEEITETLAHYNIRYTLFGDVGVAGLHRLLAAQPRIERCDSVICVAGMDGALASVVSGLCRRPIIAVPTSVGYGVCDGGRAALASMLGSCASGMCVMNIDNGFGAAIAAVRLRNFWIDKQKEYKNHDGLRREISN